jgi:heme/copper-type cytochrome/quinol oxidase subunit 2
MCETETGQQVAQHHVSLMIMTVIIIIIIIIIIYAYAFQVVCFPQVFPLKT